MFSKKQRVGRKLFAEVFKGGKRIKTGFFNITIGESEGNTPPKFSVVVSKKISKSAVVRNKNKRRIYNIILEIVKKTSIPPFEKVYLFFLKKATKREDIPILKTEIEKTFVLMMMDKFHSADNFFQEIKLKIEN